jgi:hypothetical protein
MLKNAMSRVSGDLTGFQRLPEQKKHKESEKQHQQQAYDQDPQFGFSEEAMGFLCKLQKRNERNEWLACFRGSRGKIYNNLFGKIRECKDEIQRCKQAGSSEKFLAKHLVQSEKTSLPENRLPASSEPKNLSSVQDPTKITPNLDKSYVDYVLESADKHVPKEYQPRCDASSPEKDNIVARAATHYDRISEYKKYTEELSLNSEKGKHENNNLNQDEVYKRIEGANNIRAYKAAWKLRDNLWMTKGDAGSLPDDPEQRKNLEKLFAHVDTCIENIVLHLEGKLPVLDFKQACNHLRKAESAYYWYKKQLGRNELCTQLVGSDIEARNKSLGALCKWLLVANKEMDGIAFTTAQKREGNELLIKIVEPMKNILESKIFDPDLPAVCNNLKKDIEMYFEYKDFLQNEIKETIEVCNEITQNPENNVLPWNTTRILTGEGMKSSEILAAQKERNERHKQNKGKFLGNCFVGGDNRKTNVDDLTKIIDDYSWKLCTMVGKDKQVIGCEKDPFLHYLKGIRDKAYTLANIYAVRDDVVTADRNPAIRNGAMEEIAAYCNVLQRLYERLEYAHVLGKDKGRPDQKIIEELYTRMQKDDKYCYKDIPTISAEVFEASNNIQNIVIDLPHEELHALTDAILNAQQRKAVIMGQSDESIRCKASAIINQSDKSIQRKMMLEHIYRYLGDLCGRADAHESKLSESMKGFQVYDPENIRYNINTYIEYTKAIFVLEKIAKSMKEQHTEAKEPGRIELRKQETLIQQPENGNLRILLEGGKGANSEIFVNRYKEYQNTLKELANFNKIMRQMRRKINDSYEKLLKFASENPDKVTQDPLFRSGILLEQLARETMNDTGSFQFSHLKPSPAVRNEGFERNAASIDKLQYLLNRLKNPNQLVPLDLDEPSVKQAFEDLDRDITAWEKALVNNEKRSKPGYRKIRVLDLAVLESFGRTKSPSIEEKKEHQTLSDWVHTSYREDMGSNLTYSEQGILDKFKAYVKKSRDILQHEQGARNQGAI